MIKLEFSEYKPTTISVRLSSPFLARTKCKYCNGAPSTYFYTRNPTLWYNPRRLADHFNMIKKSVKRLSTEHYYFTDPKYIREISTLSHYTSYKGYRPRLHRTRGSSPIFDIVEYLTCDCGLTTWAFSEKGVQNRPEIMSRKARHRFPQKFDF